MAPIVPIALVIFKSHQLALVLLFAWATFSSDVTTPFFLSLQLRGRMEFTQKAWVRRGADQYFHPLCLVIFVGIWGGAICSFWIVMHSLGTRSCYPSCWPLHTTAPGLVIVKVTLCLDLNAWLTALLPFVLHPNVQALSTLTSLVRMDYNIGFAMIGYFFTNRGRLAFALDKEQTVMVRLCHW